ncbi:PSP1 domain-containing protein [Paucidesulfovibrio longus]|uniref:PSP1 domain-containing protein n=1 Tax=Paucidesulfovibrio longus TaxID=889 RepID=UPI0003B3C04C|nr:regulatory iron-sulfur-containing complex subunit RicT [Paucidesulfovibrio longus]
MSHILGVKFTDYGQVYFFSSGAFVVEEGQEVIVRTEQGMGLGKVVSVEPSEEDGSGVYTPIYRLANEEDQKTRQENDDLARDAFRFCRKCVSRRELEMKLVDVEVFFDRSKMIFYFTSPGRIDFRELIKDLVREYRTRIELRQIGVRHETQMLGALGNCGQMCCCRRFMRKFVPVTIKMAKEQNLFLNPTKISGICGRLLCCLSFEQDAYEQFHKECPKTGKRFQTSLGMARVIRSNFFKKTVTAFMDDGSEKELTLDEWQEIVNKPPSEETLAAQEASARPPRGRTPSRSTGRPRQQRPMPAREENPPSASQPEVRQPEPEAAPKREESVPQPPRERQEKGAGQGEDKKNRSGRKPRRRRKKTRQPKKNANSSEQ